MSDRADISDEELIATAIRGALLDLHTALPGIVKTYDAATGTCAVLPAVKRALEREDGSTAFESLPAIPNVRVCWPGAGGFELHFPLAPGDTVLLVFNEADTGQFESSGQESKPSWLERHGLHSPVAYPYNRQPRATTGGARMVTPSPFTFGAPAAAEFVALQSQLTALNAAITSAAGTESGAGGLGGMNALKIALSGVGWPTSPATGPAKYLKAEK